MAKEAGMLAVAASARLRLSSPPSPSSCCGRHRRRYLLPLRGPMDGEEEQAIVDRDAKAEQLAMWMMEV